MKQPKLYHYPGCSTCRKARAFLAAAGVEVEAIDIVEHPPSARELAEVLARSGLPLKKLFNVSGQSYREGGFKEKLPSMTEAEALAALAADGKLIKRSILISSERALVGFDQDAWSRLT